MNGIRAGINGTTCDTFVTLCPSSNPVHTDPVGGYSLLVHGWKLFCFMHVKHAKKFKGLVGSAMDMVYLKQADSTFRWLLVGPGATVAVPSTWAHFVISFTDSVLVTWCHTPFPHAQMMSLMQYIAGNVPNPTWASATMEELPQLVQYLCNFAIREHKRASSEEAVFMNACWTKSGWQGCVAKILQRIQGNLPLKPYYKRNDFDADAKKVINASLKELQQEMNRAEQQ